MRFDPEQLLCRGVDRRPIRARHSGPLVALSDSLVSPAVVPLSGRAADRYVGGSPDQAWAVTTSTDPTSRADVTPDGLVMQQASTARLVHPGLGASYEASADIVLDRAGFGTANSMTRIKVAYSKTTEIVGIVIKDNGNGTAQVDKDGQFDTTGGTATLLGTVPLPRPLRVRVARDGRAITVRIGTASWTFQAAPAIDTATPGIGFSVWNNNKTIIRNVTVTRVGIMPEPSIARTQWSDRSPAMSGTWVIPATVDGPYEIIERVV